MPISITFGSSARPNMVRIILERKTATKEMRMVMEEVITIPHLRISPTRWGLPAPMFCPVRADTAMLMDIAGMKAKESTRPTAPKALVAALPKPFTKACDEHAAQGYEGALYYRRKADLEDGARYGLVKSEPPGIERHEVTLSVEVDDAHAKGQALGNEGRPGGPVQAARRERTEPSDKERIEHGVRPDTDGHEDEGGCRVTEPPQYGTYEEAHIHDSEGCHADLEVARRHGKILPGRIHEGKEVITEKESHHGHHHADDQGKGKRRIRHFFDHGIIFGAEVLGHEDGSGHGHTHDDTYKHENNEKTDSDGPHCIFAHQMAHPNGVHDAVAYLHDISDEHGHGKGHEMPGDTPYRQIRFPAHFTSTDGRAA